LYVGKKKKKKKKKKKNRARAVRELYSGCTVTWPTIPAEGYSAPEQEQASVLPEKIKIKAKARPEKLKDGSY